MDANTPFVQYDYDDSAVGGVAKYVRLESVTYPSDAHAIGYNYGTTGSTDDVLSRIFALTDGTGQNAPHFAEYSYLGTGKIVKTAHPGVSGGLNLDYGIDDNLSGLDRFGRVVDQIWADDSQNIVDEYKYGFDRAGDVLWKQNAGPNATGLDELYAYDEIYRLAGSERGILDLTNPENPVITGTPTKTQDWTLDGLGNFSQFDDDGATQTRDTNAANEIISTDGIATPDYDAAGNMKSDGTRKYRFDAWNRQVEVRKADDTLLATYEFDGRNRRIEKTVTQAGGGDSSGTATDYFYNTKWQVLEEQKTVSGQQNPVVTEYVWDLSYIDTPVVRRQDQNGDGDFMDENDSVLYYTTDRNHNVTSVIDPTTGDAAERYVYDAYGQVTFRDADWSPLTTGGLNTSQRPGVSSALDNKILYCGYRYDPETAVAVSGTFVISGNYHVRAREYITQFSTFDTRDPIVYRGGLNLYEYVNDVPTTFTDPKGEAIVWADCNCKCSKPGFIFDDKKDIVVHTEWDSGKYVSDDPRSDPIWRCAGACSEASKDGWTCTSDEMSPWQKLGVNKKCVVDNTIPPPPKQKGGIICIGLSGFGGYYGAGSGSAMYCWDYCTPPTSGIYLCLGGGGGMGASGSFGFTVGTGCLSSKLTGQLTVQGSAAGGVCVSTDGSDCSGGFNYGPGAGVAVTIEGCKQVVAL